MLYLLLVTVLFIGAMILGAFVVVEYGPLVLVATCVACIALFVVAAVAIGAIEGDAGLVGAQSRIKR